MRRCPCGFVDHPQIACTDSPAAVQCHQGRVSRFVDDHMDLVVLIKPLTRKELACVLSLLEA
jgi:predicted ATPase with chaperone activity